MVIYYSVSAVSPRGNFILFILFFSLSPVHFTRFRAAHSKLRDMRRGHERDVPLEHAGGHSTILVRITKNSFFNYRECVKQRLRTQNIRHSATEISKITSQEWSRMDEEKRNPYQQLANLSKTKGRSFFMRLEHLNTYIRYPNAIQFDQHVIKLIPKLNKIRDKFRTKPIRKFTPNKSGIFGGYSDT